MGLGIAAENLSVAIGSRPILRSVSLAARAGELCAIVGPNGSGKTTLLRALAGEIDYSGRIAINGADLRGMPAWQAALLRAVLPQHAALAFPFTVREVVSLGLTGGEAGVAPSQRTGLPDCALHRVDLAGFGGRLYQELSGGEQQRVQLARVLCQVWRPIVAGSPRFLLLDEPVSSLDVKHQLLIMQIARDYARDGGGVLAILHDLNLASAFADRLVLMKDGAVVAQGTPRAALTAPLLKTVFDCDLHLLRCDADARLVILPAAFGPAAAATP